MSQTGEILWVVVVIAALTRFDLIVVLFFRVLKLFRLTG